MTIRVLINGANGKMGSLAVKTLTEAPEFTVVGKLGRADDLAKAIINFKPNVVLDLTSAESVYKNTETIITSGTHPVIGTSGLLKDQIIELQNLSKEKKLGGIIVPNFSIGAILMMKCSQEIAKYYSDIEIIEMHQQNKVDSPSGTAIRSAQLISESRGQVSKPSVSREIVTGARGALYQDIPIHSIRLPGLVAHQQIIFGSMGETLTLRHDSIDRVCFMPGVVLACQKVMGLKELIYGLESIV